MLAAALLSAALAGPWVHPRGQGYVRVGLDHFQTAEGVIQGALTGYDYRSDALGLYGEWGPGHGLQLVGSLPLVSATQRAGDGPVFRHTWTGDLRLELDRALAPGLALGAELRLATYRRPEDFSNARGMPPPLLDAWTSSFPQLGDGGADLVLKALGGRGSARGWAWAEAGPRLRSSGYAHGLHAAANLGAWILPRRLALGAWSSLSLNAPWIEPERPTRQEWVVLGQATLALPERAPGWALELRGGGVPVARDASEGWMLGLGLSTRPGAPR